MRGAADGWLLLTKETFDLRLKGQTRPGRHVWQQQRESSADRRSDILIPIFDKHKKKLLKRNRTI